MLPATVQRISILLIASNILQVELGGAGALGALVVAFVAGYGWRKQGSVEHQVRIQHFFSWMYRLPATEILYATSR